MNYTSELKRFPAVQLHHEVAVPAAVALKEPNCVHMAQPCGKRAFAWFTFHKSKNVCFLVGIKNKLPISIQPVHAAFATTLSLGTVVHGTVVQRGHVRCFFMDNIYFLCGRTVEGSFAHKLTAMQTLLQTSLGTEVYLPSQLMFYVCPHSYTPTAFQLPYKLFTIKCVPLSGTKTVNYADECKVFTVRATEVCDTYELVDDVGNVVGIAGVNTYECSQALQALFRQGGRTTLDSIEESDDEGDVTTPTTTTSGVKIMCRWHPALKHWTPVLDFPIPLEVVKKSAELP